MQSMIFFFIFRVLYEAKIILKVQVYFQIRLYNCKLFLADRLQDLIMLRKYKMVITLF